MYFPTSSTRRLATVPALPNIPRESVVGLAASPHKSLFCTLTRNGVSVWLVRPSATLAYLSRSPASVYDHGDNLNAWWSPDGSRIIIETNKSFLVLISVEYKLDETVYRSPLATNAQTGFLAGAGEGLPFHVIRLHQEGVLRVEGSLVSVSPRQHHFLVSTREPSRIQRRPWPVREEGKYPTANSSVSYDTWELNESDFSWLVENEVYVQDITHHRATGIEAWITSDGRAYFVQLDKENFLESSSDSDVNPVQETIGQVEEKSQRRSTSSSDVQRNLVWSGTCIHDFKTPKWIQKQRRVEPEDVSGGISNKPYHDPRHATAVAINGRFSLTAIGTRSGTVELTNFPSQDGAISQSQTVNIPNPCNKPTGEVCALEWSSDGYVLAMGWLHGWGIVSIGGRYLASSFGVEDAIDKKKFQDTFMSGVQTLFWAPGNFELVMLAQSQSSKEENVFVMPFAKSATTGQLSPDNSRYASLVLDDRTLVYRGADQPDMSIINPESDVWQHIRIPQKYLAVNWPVRYSSLSSDGRLLAIAGRRGLIHYSSTSGRWKTFADEQQEQAFIVKGGLLWFHHVLIAAVEVAKSYQIRLYSRDLELSSQNILHREILSSPVVILSLIDNSLLVYTQDNTLYHFLVVPTTDSIQLYLCGSITFTGIIAVPNAVRMLSWMIPSAQKHLGDPVDDLTVATVLMVVGGQLILLRPRKAADQEVKYDMQIFADRIEFCWIHLRGIGALENSLWAYDTRGMRVWLNALTIEPHASRDEKIGNVKESVNIPLDFYPLSVLMDKGIIIGAEYEASTRSNLPFVMFRHATSSHLFLQHILLYHLEAKQVKEAVVFASHYKNLVFFAHALEMLLHTVVESDASATYANDPDSEGGSSSSDTVLPEVIEFLDHFDVALDVVVGCARKTEVTRWRRLFDIVGNPKALFEACLASNALKTAGSYLLVLHNLEQLEEESDDAVRLLKAAVENKDWQLCCELLRFLRSIDESGNALRTALAQVDVLHKGSGDGHHSHTGIDL